MFNGRMNLKMDMNLDKKEFEENNVNTENNTNIVDNSKKITNNKPGGLTMINTATTNNVNDTNNDTSTTINNEQVNDQNVDQGGGFDIKLVFIGILVAVYYMKKLRI
jgi:hypothetical protein